MKRDLLKSLTQARAKGTGAVLATRLDDGVQRLIATGDRGDALAIAAQSALARDKSGGVEIDGASWFLNVFNSPPKLYIIGAVHMPEKAPPGNRLDIEQLASDVRKHGVPAKAITRPRQIVDYVSERVAAGDTVVVMSSGSFDGLHDNLLRSLGDAVVATLADGIDAAAFTRQVRALAGVRYVEPDAYQSTM